MSTFNDHLHIYCNEQLNKKKYLLNKYFTIIESIQLQYITPVFMKIYDVIQCMDLQTTNNSIQKIIKVISTNELYF